MDHVEQLEQLTDLRKKRVNRRNFLAGAGAVGAATVLAGCNDSTTAVSTPPTTTNPTFTDFDILNFALNLEYLEAEFYLYAATGAGLSATDAGTGTGLGTTTGGSASLKLTGLTPAQQNIVNEIAYDEQSHVQFLRKAITAAGGVPVPRPAIDLTFFAPLAVAAKIPGATATGATAFSPFVSFDAFILGAFVFEDVGVTAYSGAAPLITAAGVKSGILAAAAGILAVEAYHAAYVRTVITGRAINATATTYATIANANLVSTLRAALGGANETPLTLPTANIASATAVGTPVYASSIVAATTANAIAFARTTDQVHHIVYGSATVGASKGGFFPNGTNSIFSVTST